MAERKSRVDGISLSIVIMNILIALTVIVLVVLIYLYMTGKLEETDVANMGQSTEAAVITTTPISTSAPETEPEDDAEDDAVLETDAPDFEASDSFDTTASEDDTTAEPEETDDTESTADMVAAVETDDYDPAFFENDLFIGDSIYTGLVNYGYFDNDHVFAQIGLNPESARTKEYSGYTAVSKAKERQPKRIFIMLGSNGLAYMGNTYMTEQMKLLIEELREVTPDSYIFVVSIPPVTKAHDSEGQETMVMVNGYNKMLRTMTEEVGVVYLDLCSKLQDASGYFSDEYAEADGLHFLGAAYKHMLSFFQKTISV